MESISVPRGALCALARPLWGDCTQKKSGPTTLTRRDCCPFIMYTVPVPRAGRSLT